MAIDSGGRAVGYTNAMVNDDLATWLAAATGDDPAQVAAELELGELRREFVFNELVEAGYTGGDLLDYSGPADGAERARRSGTGGGLRTAAQRRHGRRVAAATRGWPRTRSPSAASTRWLRTAGLDCHCRPRSSWSANAPTATAAARSRCRSRSTNGCARTPGGSSSCRDMTRRRSSASSNCTRRTRSSRSTPRAGRRSSRPTRDDRHPQRVVTSSACSV